MKPSAAAIIAGVALAAPAMARAADLIAMPTSNDNSLPIAEAGIDWSGFYAGVYGVGRDTLLDGVQTGLGINVGVNTQFEFVLVGAEVDVQGLVGGLGGTAYLQGVGRAGVLLADNLILYGVGGAGIDLTTTGEADALLGGGLELALTDDVSVDARYLRGVPLSGGNPKDQVTLGANFHF